MDYNHYQDIVSQAEGFCKAAHFDQVRKYTEEPYFTHCREVAFIVSCIDPKPRAQVVAAAWLHDVLEDTDIDEEYLRHCFGDEITNLVLEVTDVSVPEDGNRKLRKELDRQHLMKSSPNGATIKLADLIHNTQNIVKYDPDFARIYLDEKERLLPHLFHGNTGLWHKAMKVLQEGQQHLVQLSLGK